ncbi:hypothetical protein M2114_001199 [Aurantimicrobium minutum]|uniref:DUF2142 domain-containing protein n=1 Tax=Aurantimicrobium minutum TaxID=708131 RepID=UPI002474D8A5|nr:DUF2142 domain-containing protein [Aurantimicrobium minutum]MDH6425082.1 hypothetical protein [Aurantimicrobium minutum]
MKSLFDFVPSNKNKILGILFSLSIFISLLTWSLSSPVGSSPDDDFHLVSIWCGEGNKTGVCELEPNGKEAIIPRAIMASPCFAYSPDTTGACQGPTGVQPSDLTLKTDRGNFTGMYPRGFYWVMSHFVSADINASVVSMRVFNSALFSILTLLLFWFAPLRKKFKVSLALLVALVPLGLFIIPSTNPSSWAITSACIFFPSLISYFYQTGWKKWGSAILATTTLIIGFSARADSAIYSLLALFIAILLNFKTSNFKLFDWLFTFSIVTVSVLVYFSAGQSSFATNGMNDSGANTAGFALSDVKLIITNLTQLPLLWTGALGQWGLGWLDTKMPGAVWIGSFFAFSALIFWAIGGRLGRRNKVALAVVLVSVVAVPSYLLLRSNAQVGSYIQPRYILPLLILAAAVAIVPDRTFELKLERMQQISIIFCLAVANSFALHTNIRRYTVGDSDYLVNLDSRYEWWWQFGPTPMTIWILGTVFFAVAISIATTNLFPALTDPKNSIIGGRTNGFK